MRRGGGEEVGSARGGGEWKFTCGGPGPRMNSGLSAWFAESTLNTDDPLGQLTVATTVSPATCLSTLLTVSAHGAYWPARLAPSTGSLRWVVSDVSLVPM